MPNHKHIRKLKQILPLNLHARKIYSDYPAEPESISERIKKKRLDLDMNTVEFADYLGDNKSSVRDWEAGRSEPGGGLEKLGRINI